MITLTDYQVNISISTSCVDTFNRICQVSDWWTSDLEGETRGVGSAFTVHFGDTFVDFTITEFVPSETVAWHVTNCYLPWLNDKTEWNGTTARFEVAPTSEGSQVRFTHVGLNQNMECFEGCSEGWGHFIVQSLSQLIMEGKGCPKGAGNE